MLLENLVTRRVSEENASKSSLTRRVTKQGIKQNDKDGDGKLTGDEIPERMRQAMARIDTKSDNSVDEAELDQMLKSFGGGGGRGGRPPVIVNQPRTAIAQCIDRQRNSTGHLVLVRFTSVVLVSRGNESQSRILALVALAGPLEESR